MKRQSIGINFKFINYNYRKYGFDALIHQKRHLGKIPLDSRRTLERKVRRRLPEAYFDLINNISSGLDNLCE
jgi:hypothetical protein